MPNERYLNLQPWSPCISSIYDPIQVGSIDGTDIEPHDSAVVRAINSVYRPNKGVVGDANCTLFIAGFSRDTEEDDIKSLFEQDIPIKRVNIVRDIISGISKQYAFVEFNTIDDARKAFDKLGNYAILKDKKLIIEFELERKVKGWKPRRFGGGLGGKKESGQLRFGGRQRRFQKPLRHHYF